MSDANAASGGMRRGRQRATATEVLSGNFHRTHVWCTALPETDRHRSADAAAGPRRTCWPNGVVSGTDVVKPVEPEAVLMLADILPAAYEVGARKVLLHK